MFPILLGFSTIQQIYTDDKRLMHFKLKQVLFILANLCLMFFWYYSPFFHALTFKLFQIAALAPYKEKEAEYLRILLEVLNQDAISENAYELSTEASFEIFEWLPISIDIQRLRELDEIITPLSESLLSLKQNTQSELGPPEDTIESVRNQLKISRKQFKKCWEVLIYLKLDLVEKYMVNFKSYRTMLFSNIEGEISQSSGKKFVDHSDETRKVIGKRIKDISRIAHKVRPQLFLKYILKFLNSIAWIR